MPLRLLPALCGTLIGLLSIPFQTIFERISSNKSHPRLVAVVLIISINLPAVIMYALNTSRNIPDPEETVKKLFSVLCDFLTMVTFMLSKNEHEIFNVIELWFDRDMKTKPIPKESSDKLR